MGFEDKSIYHKALTPEKETTPNSLESLLEHYRGAVECDLILSGNDVVAVLHERDFGKTLEEIEKLSSEDIERLKIPLKDGSLSSQAVPFVQEYAGLASDMDAETYFELKASSTEKAIRLARISIEQLAKMNEDRGFSPNLSYLERKTEFQSFSLAALKEVNDVSAKYNLKIRTGLYWPTPDWQDKVPLFDQALIADVKFNNLSWNDKAIELAASNGISTVEFQPFAIDEGLVGRAHQRGLRIGSSIVKDENEARKLIEIGVDYVKV